MTRLKELKRIESAIEQKNPAELQWALEYCRMRLKIAARKDHTHSWRKMEERVKQR
jgi:hypothetical protein